MPVILTELLNRVFLPQISDILINWEMDVQAANKV